jgi:nitroimidazol reductase NimA-like FMN-containing flavoprotein (pyridoxamine 5'-phosphate oxidase superfamily)
MVGEVKQLSVDVTADEINACQTMQLATSCEDQPWNATVYFVVNGGNFYWLSFPERRHSQDLTVNQRAAIAIVLQSTQPVVGVQSEGDVSVVNDLSEVERVLDMYIEKYDQGKQFVQLFKKGNNKHELYRFVPRRIFLFDERNGSAVTLPKEITIT